MCGRHNPRSTADDIFTFSIAHVFLPWFTFPFSSALNQNQEAENHYNFHCDVHSTKATKFCLGWPWCVEFITVDNLKPDFLDKRLKYNGVIFQTLFVKPDRYFHSY